jgi:hypothetical protein
LQPYTTTTSSFLSTYAAAAPAPVAQSPSPLAASPPLVPTDDIPPLSLEALDDPEEKAEGLNLIAESVSQMRPRATRAVLLHPLPLTAYAGTLLTTCTGALPALPSPREDLGSVLMLASAITITYLLAAHLASGVKGYAGLAEQINWPSWLVGPDGDEDIILGARLGDTIVGALVLRLMPNPGLAGKRKTRTACLRGGRGVIRAWTTDASHRREGIGRDLLLSAVRITKEKCGRDAEVGFAKEHANSVMLLPDIFNRPFRRDEIMATKVLDGALAEWEMSKKKR